MSKKVVVAQDEEEEEEAELQVELEEQVPVPKKREKVVVVAVQDEEQAKPKKVRTKNLGYIPEKVLRDGPDARKILRDEETKGSKRIQRAPQAAVKINPSTGQLDVTVKKGRGGAKAYEYEYIEKLKLGPRIKSDMEKDKLVVMNWERLAAAYPVHYWNAVRPRLLDLRRVTQFILCSVGACARRQSAMCLLFMWP